MIPVTKPFLPPQEEYQKYLDGIWTRKWLTNMGPLANDLELRLKEILKVKHLLFLTNGTVAIQMAIKALELKGEIITTPFSFVATTSCIVWENCKPIFVDIDKNSLNIDAEKIEAAITDKTSAILATHVYGNPCPLLVHLVENGMIEPDNQITTLAVQMYLEPLIKEVDDAAEKAQKEEHIEI